MAYVHLNCVIATAQKQEKHSSKNEKYTQLGPTEEKLKEKQ